VIPKSITKKYTIKKGGNMKKNLVLSVLLLFVATLVVVTIITITLPQETKAGSWKEVCCGSRCDPCDYCTGTGTLTCCKTAPGPDQTW
jgi:hypothetical protein